MSYRLDFCYRFAFETWPQSHVLSALVVGCLTWQASGFSKLHILGHGAQSSSFTVKLVGLLTGKAWGIMLLRIFGREPR